MPALMYGTTYVEHEDYLHQGLCIGVHFICIRVVLLVLMENDGGAGFRLIFVHSISIFPGGSAIARG